MNGSGFIDRNSAIQNIPMYESVIADNPTDYAAMGNLGSCYFVVGEIDKAVACFERAYAGDPGNSQICMNLGMAYKDLGRMSECAKLVQEAHTIDPEFFYIRLGWAECLLRGGHWKAAWKLYGAARFTRKNEHDMHRTPQHITEWKDLDQKISGRLLVFGEGGFGDRICYSRWLPELTRRGIDWSFHPNAVQPAEAFTELFLPQPWCEGRILRQPFSFDGFSHWTTTFELPGILEATPTRVPFWPEPFRLQDYAPAMEIRGLAKQHGEKPILGLIWTAGEKFEGDRKFRSLTEGQAMRLICSTSDQVTWVNCQFGQVLPKPALNVRFQSWQDTAALLAAMDGVVSVDTGPMHLAGALSKPMSVLLSGNSDWKFLMGTSKCYFYPTAKLFRNEHRVFREATRIQIGVRPEQGFEVAIDQVVDSIRRGEIGWQRLQ